VSEVLAPHVLPPGSRAVPVAASTLPPGVGVAVLAAVAVVGVLLAAAPGQPGFRILLGALAVFAAVSAVLLVPWTRAVETGRVRLDPDADALRFVAPRALPVGMLALAVVALAAGVLALVLRLAGVAGASEVGIGAVGPLALGAVGLGWLGQQLLALRVPAGLTLDADGIRGVRGTRQVDIAWHDLAGVDVLAARGARLVLTPRDAGPVVLDPHWFGSDPNVVAVVIAHFRDHPADRSALADGRTAIRVVEEAVSPRA